MQLAENAIREHKQSVENGSNTDFSLQALLSVLIEMVVIRKASSSYMGLPGTDCINTEKIIILIFHSKMNIIFFSSIIVEPRDKLPLKAAVKR